MLPFEFDYLPVMKEAFEPKHAAALGYACESPIYAAGLARLGPPFGDRKDCARIISRLNGPTDSPEGLKLIRRAKPAELPDPLNVANIQYYVAENTGRNLFQEIQALNKRQVQELRAGADEGSAGHAGPNEHMVRVSIPLPSTLPFEIERLLDLDDLDPSTTFLFIAAALHKLYGDMAANLHRRPPGRHNANLSQLFSALFEEP